MPRLCRSGLGAPDGSGATIYPSLWGLTLPSFGLTFLSRAALREAEQLMLGDRAGVRDEVGFLLVHQRYADRFFPGTSVLHTRLRYALFVPWILERLKARGVSPQKFAKALEDEEIRLARRLLDGAGGAQESGVIGRLSLPGTTSQPPSYVYWTALTAWGLLSEKPNLRPYGRADIGALIAALRDRSPADDDGRPLETVVWPVHAPPAPDEWDGDGPLRFKLGGPERRHMAVALRGVRWREDPSEPALLARLVGEDLEGVGACWDKPVLSLAGPHRAPLERAGRAAALSAIGRGVYAALVETLKEDDGRDAGTLHRDALPGVVSDWRTQAIGLDPELLLGDLGANFPSYVADVLRETLTWVRDERSDVRRLLPVYRRAELRRKTARARLASEQRGVDRRIEWDGAQHGSAEPLHYRWGRVTLLLSDLVGA